MAGKRIPSIGENNSKNAAVLRVLQADSARSGKVLAHQVGLSTPAFSRARVLAEHQGVIKRTIAVLDRTKLGFHALGFFTVTCRDNRAADSVSTILATYPEVQEVHILDGPHPLFVKACGRTNEDLAKCQEKILGLDGVQSVRVKVAMRTIRETLDVPI